MHVSKFLNKSGVLPSHSSSWLPSMYWIHQFDVSRTSEFAYITITIIRLYVSFWYISYCTVRATLNNTLDNLTNFTFHLSFWSAFLLFQQILFIKSKVACSVTWDHPEMVIISRNFTESVSPMR